MFSSSSYWVRISTFVSGYFSVICFVASSPLMMGMIMSITATLGVNRCTLSMASRPSTASPTTSMSFCRASSAPIPSLTTAWSSTTSTLILLSVLSRNFSAQAATEADSTGLIKYCSASSFRPSSIRHPLTRRFSGEASTTMRGTSLKSGLCLNHWCS